MFGRIGMSEYNRRGACYRGVSYAPLSYYGSSDTDSLNKNFLGEDYGNRKDY